MKIRITTLISILIVAFGTSLMAQSQTHLDQALRFIEDKQIEWNLEKADIEELAVSDMYTSDGVTHIYFKQHHKGIPVNNAIASIVIAPNGKVYGVGTPPLVQDLKSKVNTTRPTVEPVDAIVAAANQTKLRNPKAPQLLEKFTDQSFLFDKGDLSYKDIPVSLEYFVSNDGEVSLAWMLEMDEKYSHDWWQVHVDAKTGEVLNKIKFTVSCQFDHKPFHNHDAACRETEEHSFTPVKQALQNNATLVGESTYRAFAFPAESPSHTTHELVDNPADLVASPFGWHDTNGMDGAEYTITRGNNVHAFQDHTNINSSSGDEPDGGTDLIFDFPYKRDSSVIFNTNSAVVNLFYANNFVHDFTYAHGFDEASGNFQHNNYGNGGVGSDAVQANAQDGYLTGSLNNANFSTPPDGSSGRMQMFVWDDNVAGSEFLTVTEPPVIARGYPSIAAGFGPAPPTTPIVAEVIEVNDGVFNELGTDGCEEVINTDEIAGKIALVDRGGCYFEDKAHNAEAAGAVALIICNFEPDPMGMAGSPNSTGPPSIPTISIGSVDCQTIRQFAGQGLKASIGSPLDNGPEFLDGDYDNGIIAHEYGHGISNRLTGGPQAAGCLGNPEQMGEGWSDFYSLVSTMREGDSGEMRRGVGTYVLRQDNDGGGIRRYPYSTDMTVNPLTFSDVAGNTQVHALGEVWATMCWDLVWAMIEKYDFDPDLVNGTGGNNMAVKLVTEGMKNQQCSPGFEQGRDGILLADEIFFNGENQCLIWDVFARRGLGIDASSGQTSSATDQIEDFNSLPTCIQEMKIRKTVTPIVNAGDIINVEITVTNHRPETATNVVVTDELLDGLSYVDGSSNFPTTVVGDVVSTELGDLEFGAERIIRYELTTATDKFSASLYFDGCETNDNWLRESLGGTNNWDLSTEEVYDGSRAWRIEDDPTETQQLLFTSQMVTITGDQPVLRFYHSFNTEGGQDGGFVQITTDPDFILWDRLDPSSFVRNPYPGEISYFTFTIPFLSGFSGNSNGFVDTYIDLSAYVGQDVAIRYNFGTSDANALTNGFWAIDNFELMDVFSYDPEACVSFDQGENVCANAGQMGTVVETGEMVSTQNPALTDVNLAVFPNPASEVLSVQISGKESTNAELSLVSMDGRTVMSQAIDIYSTKQTIPLDVREMPAGFYLLKVRTVDGILVEKVVVE